MSHETAASIILVVADEMANPVRSVTAELARENKSVRLLVHPTFRVRRHPVTY
jgi:glutamate dehydrogenase